ncbi:glycerophosphodiester phosphodiesterase family protein [Echinicola sp. 20G]|uniref:glycerophosphodiester phosphodiesterase family protein n=1 Tax=Echinicola sp. 20G TaxID=2781961 RepID=UPI001910F638|nr:glycerophosphodiester phosphodiesterase family protein [Echinicola sp. 20G]
MKTIKVIHGVLLCLFINLFGAYGQSSEDGERNFLRFATAQELHEFFTYTGRNSPLISGHRGGKESGYPENSIEAFANTLKHTPVFFEIDPRLTKDSIIVLMHDASLERTTNGHGKLRDISWKEAQQLCLKDVNGILTDLKIPSLEEVILWSKGKTIVNLDHKDVPMEMTVALVKRLNAFDHVMITVHDPSEASYYLKQHPDFMFSAFIRNQAEFNSYEEAGIPWSQIMAYVGPMSKPENQALYDQLHAKGVLVMISAAPSYDKMDNKEEQFDSYIKVFEEGADVLESDYPIEVAKALKSFIIL